jgi:hypothetical protein
MPRCHLSVIVFLLLFGLGGMLAGQTISEHPTDAETYAAYSAVIKKMFLPTEVKRLVIVKETLSYFPTYIESERQTLYLDNFPDLEAETAEDAKIKKETGLLKKRFVLPVECTLITSDEVNGHFGPPGSGGWISFNQAYPLSRGFLRFSRVAFNRSATQAFLYVEHRCGGLCGTGHHVFLSKQDGNWVVKKTHLLWIS